MNTQNPQFPKIDPKMLEEADEKVGIVELVSGRREDGSPCYSYVSIKPSKYEEYLKAHEEGRAIDLEDFGEVLHSGEGSRPSSEVMREMEQQYNVNHNFEQEFKTMLEQMAKEQATKK